MSSTGSVRVFDGEEGWGVIDSVDTPGGCWVHFSAIVVDGYRSLATGQDVTFTFEAVRQDGFDYRAINAWPAGSDGSPPEPTDTGRAYTSLLTIEPQPE